MTATVRGVTRTESLQVLPDTQSSAESKERECERIQRLEAIIDQLRTLPNQFVNPLGPDNPVTYFETHPYSKDTLVRLQRSLATAQAVLTNAVLSTAPASNLLRQSIAETQALIEAQ